MVDIHVSNELSRLFNQAEKLLQKRRDNFISSDLLLLACQQGKG
jgi:ATP-dependent Clp protease ATP-binding subunit ClpB